MQETALDFLQRGDNSRAIMSRKKDAKKVAPGVKKKKKILMDYLHNLYIKFTSENPYCKIWLTSFCACGLFISHSIISHLIMLVCVPSIKILP